MFNLFEVMQWLPFSAGTCCCPDRELELVATSIELISKWSTLQSLSLWTRTLDSKTNGKKKEIENSMYWLRKIFC